jgi:hypothetical protein
MDSKNDKTQVQLTKNTLGRLREIGKKGETWDDIVNKVVDKYEEANHERNKGDKGQA